MITEGEQGHKEDEGDLEDSAHHSSFLDVLPQGNRPSWRVLETDGFIKQSECRRVLISEQSCAAQRSASKPLLGNDLSLLRGGEGRPEHEGPTSLFCAITYVKGVGLMAS